MVTIKAVPGHRRAVDPDSLRAGTPTEAKSAVAYTRYPPAGLRGVAGGRERRALRA